MKDEKDGVPEKGDVKSKDLPPMALSRAFMYLLFIAIFASCLSACTPHANESETERKARTDAQRSFRVSILGAVSDLVCKDRPKSDGKPCGNREVRWEGVKSSEFYIIIYGVTDKQEISSIIEYARGYRNAKKMQKNTLVLVFYDHLRAPSLPAPHRLHKEILIGE